MKPAKIGETTVELGEIKGNISIDKIKALAMRVLATSAETVMKGRKPGNGKTWENYEDSAEYQLKWANGGGHLFWCDIAGICPDRYESNMEDAYSRGKAENRTILATVRREADQMARIKVPKSVRQPQKYGKHIEIMYNGKSLTLAEWSEERGIPYATMASRLNAGKTIDEVFSTKRLPRRDFGRY